jgi:hypothetical protein
MKREKPVEVSRRALQNTDQGVEPDSTRQSPGAQLASFPFDSAVTRPTWPELLLTYVHSDSFPVTGRPATRFLDGIPIIEQALKEGKERILAAMESYADSVPGYSVFSGAHVRELYAVQLSKIWRLFQRVLAQDKSLSFDINDVLACARLNLGECVERFAHVNDISPKEAAAIIDRILNGVVPVRVNRPSIRKLSPEAALLQAGRIREKEDQP